MNSRIDESVYFCCFLQLEPTERISWQLNKLLISYQTINIVLNYYYRMNQLKRKVVVSSEQKLCTQKAETKGEQEHPHEEEDQSPIESMARKQPVSKVATQQLRNPNRDKKQKQISKQGQKQKRQERSEDEQSKPPQKLLLYHRPKRDVLILDGEPQEGVLKIDMRSTERKQNQIDDRSNKMPYRFAQ